MVALIWATLLQTPPVDPNFFNGWDRLGIVGILVAVIAFGAWFLMKLLNRESERADRLDASNLELTRQHEHMSLEFISAVRELSGEVKALQDKCGDLERELALLHARLGRSP